MRVTKQPRLDFDYLDTIHKINKMQGSPRYLSKVNLAGSKSPNAINFPKDSILNNIPIKVRLIHAAELNPNINLGKIHNINRNSKTLKKEIEIKKDKSNSKKNEINNENDNSKYSKKESDKTNNELNKTNIKNENDDLNEINTLSPKIGLHYNQSDIYKLKKLLISPKSGEKENQSTINKNNLKINKLTPNTAIEDKDNYDLNTYNQNDNNKNKNTFPQNLAYNKPKKGNISGNPHTMINQKGFKKNVSNNNPNEVKEFENKSYILSNYDNSSVCSSNPKINSLCKSPKIIKIKKNNKIINNINNSSTNNIHSNTNINKIKLSPKRENKNYGLNTYIQKNPNVLITNRLNTSPIRIRNNSNNNSFNFNNNFNYNINFLSLSPKKEDNININYDNIDIKLDDLILFEERLSDISIALSNNKNIYDGEASNECIEFFVFYFHSSLKQIFPYFFNGMNKVIIKSAINLKLFTIVITYHLSMNPEILSKLTNELKNIFSLSKMNLYLMIKKIQLFYGENYTKQNEMYFKTFNYILTKKGLINCNEEEIVKIINQNCYEIVKNLNVILNFYKSIENNYYLDFLEMFISISKITEKEINNYFYNHLYANSSKGTPQPKYNNSPKKNIQFEGVGIITDNIRININKNSARGKIETSPNKILKYRRFVNKHSDEENSIILEYQKNKISPPFLKTPNKKKYTVVLDLDETLVNVNQNGVCNLRPGLFSFLNAIKPFYEIISFTNGEKSYSDSIIKQIEARNQYFDYNFYREHSFLSGREFLKDISRIGRDMKKIIIVDNIANNFKLNPDNGIQIAPYFGEYSKNDTVLFELKKLLIMFLKLEYEDLRTAIKNYAKDIKNNITRENEE